MSTIDKLISSLQHSMIMSSRAGGGYAARVFVASQNLAKVRVALAKIAWRLSNGSAWDDVEIPDAAVLGQIDHLMQELYFRHRMLIEVWQKPQPHPGGDFIMADCTGFNQVFWDMDVDEQFILSVTIEGAQNG